LNLPEGTAGGVCKFISVSVNKLLVTELTVIFNILWDINLQFVAKFVEEPVTLN
jgi:hypothetical protein